MEEGYKAIGFIVGAIIVYLLQKLEKSISKSKKNKAFSPNLDISAKIQLEIEHIRMIADASRATLIDYDNGVENYTGLPFNFASISYESVDTTTMPIIRDFQRVPISPIASLLLELNNSNDRFVRHTDEDPNKSIATYERVYGVTTSYSFRMYDSVKNGVINITWLNGYHQLTEEQLTDIIVCIERIKLFQLKIKKY